MSYAMRKLQQQIRRSSLLGGGGTKIPHSPSSSSLPASESHHGADHLPSSESPSSLPQPRTTNVILFGETGVGKSSVINLIARKAIAKVSSDVNGCTMESTPYQISFDDMNYTIFDTIGLEEPEMGVNGYLKAIEKAFGLITTLEAAGGIHLLLFCMRGGRITATAQSNYRMFYECLCRKEVPIALVFTGLEREVDMENWWRRNESYIVQYGIKSRGHACITAVHDGTHEELDKYNQSQNRIRDLIKTCALESRAPLPEPHSLFAKFAKGMMSFIKKRSDPGRKKLLRVLTQRCHLAPDVAERIVNMMEKSDPEPNEDDPKQPGDEKDQRGSSSSAAATTNVENGPAENVQQHGTVSDNQDTTQPQPFSSADTPTGNMGGIKAESGSAAGITPTGEETRAEVSLAPDIAENISPAATITNVENGTAENAHQQSTTSDNQDATQSQPFSSAGAAPTGNMGRVEAEPDLAGGITPRQAGASRSGSLLSRPNQVHFPTSATVEVKESGDERARYEETPKDRSNRVDPAANKKSRDVEGALNDVRYQPIHSTARNAEQTGNQEDVGHGSIEDAVKGESGAAAHKPKDSSPPDHHVTVQPSHSTSGGAKEKDVAGRRSGTIVDETTGYLPTHRTADPVKIRPSRSTGGGGSNPTLTDTSAGGRSGTIKDAQRDSSSRVELQSLRPTGGRTGQGRSEEVMEGSPNSALTRQLYAERTSGTAKYTVNDGSQMGHQPHGGTGQGRTEGSIEGGLNPTLTDISTEGRRVATENVQKDGNLTGYQATVRPLHSTSPLAGVKQPGNRIGTDGYRLTVTTAPGGSRHGSTANNPLNTSRKALFLDSTSNMPKSNSFAIKQGTEQARTSEGKPNPIPSSLLLSTCSKESGVTMLVHDQRKPVKESVDSSDESSDDDDSWKVPLTSVPDDQGSVALTGRHSIF